ncbi:MAG: hypothetical protein BWY31_03074 [Lentisphaerae bacterium ADurb.Bin242]|nr:MAG: hypothetical protein BWY31_03074 [Lentisphaerae bacterium ADurb.Bin242]
MFQRVSAKEYNVLSFLPNSSFFAQSRKRDAFVIFRSKEIEGVPSGRQSGPGGYCVKGGLQEMY